MFFLLIHRVDNDQEFGYDEKKGRVGDGAGRGLSETLPFFCKF